MQAFRKGLNIEALLHTTWYLKVTCIRDPEPGNVNSQVFGTTQSNVEIFLTADLRTLRKALSAII